MIFRSRHGTAWLCASGSGARTCSVENSRPDQEPNPRTSSTLGSALILQPLPPVALATILRCHRSSGKRLKTGSGCARIAQNWSITTGALFGGRSPRVEGQGGGFHPRRVRGEPSPPPTDLSAEIDISYTKNRITGERHDYLLQITLTNRGTEPLGAYHIDLVMPALVVSSPEAQPSYVQEKSTGDVAFFRTSSHSDKEQDLSGRHQARFLYSLLRGSNNLLGIPQRMAVPPQAGRYF